jgi:4-amino-4-deoxy-L-arabinose transferase-like glycosyltransferase
MEPCPQNNSQLQKLFNSVFPDRTSIVLFLLAFKRIFDSERTGFVAALIALIGTSLPLWAVTGKDHSVSLLFIMLAIYCYYSHVQSNRSSYKHLAFAMVGLEVWVRAEAAIPLFCALFLTELLFVYRNNTARAQLQNVMKIVAGICLANHKITRIFKIKF